MNNVKKVTIWHALRDVILAGMNNGQLLLLFFMLIFIVIVIRIPVETFETVGPCWFWITVSLLLLLLFGTYSKYLRKRLQEEIDRLAEEKRELQEALAGKPLRSSRPAKRRKKRK